MHHGIMTIEEEITAKILYLLNYKIPNEYYDLYMKLVKDSKYYEVSGNQWNTTFNVRNKLLFINQNRLKSFKQLNNIKADLENLIQIFSNETKKKKYLKEEKERREQLIEERINHYNRKLEIKETDNDINKMTVLFHNIWVSWNEKLERKREERLKEKGTLIFDGSQSTNS